MEPATKAGKRLLEDSGPYVITGEHSLVERILAIEQEAREGYVRADVVAVQMTLVQMEARADLAARIVAAVEGLPGYRDPRYSGRSEATGIVDRAAVLDAIREATK